MDRLKKLTALALLTLSSATFAHDTSLSTIASSQPVAAQTQPNTLTAQTAQEALNPIIQQLQNNNPAVLNAFIQSWQTALLGNEALRKNLQTHLQDVYNQLNPTQKISLLQQLLKIANENHLDLDDLAQNWQTELITNKQLRKNLQAYLLNFYNQLEPQQKAVITQKLFQIAHQHS